LPTKGGKAIQIRGEKKQTYCQKGEEDAEAKTWARN